MPDAAAAVAALQAAGKDVQKLLQAIESASFLDEIPGEDRQRLRGKPELLTMGCTSYLHS
jgi:hypothetical protein